jgi:hypothetical protein
MSDPLKHVRYLPQGDKEGAEKLRKLGYEFRGISGKGSQIFVLANSPRPSDDDLDAIETTFGLERDLQQALRKNIEQLEPGLKIIDGNKEKPVESGRIDITAEDQTGTTVVIELKAEAADRDAIGQLLSYMGNLLADGRGQVRGILVAGDFTPRAIAAAKAVPNIELRKYGFTFTFSLVQRQ